MTRRTLIVMIVAAALVIGVWWLRQSDPSLTNLPPRSTGPWIAFGDSLTAGYGASKGNDYPALLSRALAIPILNLGANGATTTDGLRRVESVAQRSPRVVLLCLGGNDALAHVPIGETVSNLRTIIERLHASGSFVVLIGIRSGSLMDRNEDHFRGLARETGALYVEDFLQGLAFKPIYMTDAIHPNDAGYQRFAERLERELRPLMTELAASTGGR